LAAKSSSLRFSRRWTPFTTSAIWCTGSEISLSGLGATSTGQLLDPGGSLRERYKKLCGSTSMSSLMLLLRLGAAASHSRR
jgi:hypothetical protein